MHWQCSSLRAVHKRCRKFFGRFLYPPPPYRNFDPDLPNFYDLISCNIGIWDSPPPLKYSDVFYGWPLCANCAERINIKYVYKSASKGWKALVCEFLCVYAGIIISGKGCHRANPMSFSNLPPKRKWPWAFYLKIMFIVTYELLTILNKTETWSWHTKLRFFFQGKLVIFLILLTIWYDSKHPHYIFFTQIK